MRAISISLTTVGVLVSMGAGTAGATTITQTIDYGPSYTDWTNSYVFTQFNPSLGTLNFVTVESQGILNIMTATFTDPTKTAETLTSYQETFQATLTGPSGTNQNSTVALPSIGPITLGPAGSGSDTASQNASDQSGNLVTNTYTSSLGVYEGLGTVTFNGAAQALQMFSGDSNIDWGATTTASQDVTLIYNYTPTGIPEPFSMVLSGSGLAVMLLGGKRLARSRGGN